jgi:hypothetical protein
MNHLKYLRLSLNHRSEKRSRRNEAPKRQGARQKFGNVNKSALDGTNIQTARGSDKINEIKYRSIAEFRQINKQTHQCTRTQSQG